MQTFSLSFKGLSVALVSGSLVFASGLAQAAWPERPVTLVVPTAPGGGNDHFARLIAQKMGEDLGQTFVVVNKAGAQGAIGSEFVARAANDGYTMLFGYIATHGINPALSNLRYDPVKDFEPLGMVASSPTLLVVNSNAGINSVQDLINKAKKDPQALSYASAGIGTAPHVTAELFKMAADIDMLHVPYKGSAPAMADTLGGVTQVMFPSVFGASSYFSSGKIKPLAVAGSKRLDVLKDVPTLEEVGVKGVEVPQWYAMFAPAGTSPEIVKAFNASLNKALNDPYVQQKFAEGGAEVQSSTPEALKEYVKSEVERWKKVVEAAKIQAN